MEEKERVGPVRTALRWLGELIVIALVSLLIGVAFVFADDKLNPVAGVVVALLLALPAARVIVWPLRRWKVGDFSPKVQERRRRQRQVPGQGMGRALLGLVAFDLAVVVVLVLVFSAWPLAIALIVLSVVTMLPLHAAWLFDYQRLDLRVLARRDAWLRPNRLRRELRG